MESSAINFNTEEKDMKIYEWNIGMAATFGCNNGYPIQPWIIDEITIDKPECFVLTEFVVSKGWDDMQEKLEAKGYKWFISGSSGQNGILIAIKSNENIDLSYVFGYKENTVKNGAALNTTCPPNFYEVSFKIGKKDYSLIGLRVRVKDKQQQFNALDSYLASLEEMGIKVFCIGDFNAYWFNTWVDPIKNTTLPKTAKKFELYTPLYNNGKGDWFSYINPMIKAYDGKQQLDHLITNVNVNVKSRSYDWSFIDKHKEGYDLGTKATTPNKTKGMPDHAIFKVELDLYDNLVR